jgi:hypothetical protein
VLFVVAASNGPEILWRSCVEIPTMCVMGGRLLVRLFNAEATGKRHVVSFCRPPTNVEMVELDGRRIREIDVRLVA